MSWSYTPGASQKDTIRFMIADTNAAVPLLQDEEIYAAIAQEPDTNYCAALCLDAMANNFIIVLKVGKMGDMSVEGDKVALAMRTSAQNYRTLTDDVPAIGWAEQTLNSNNVEEILWNNALRTQT